MNLNESDEDYPEIALVARALYIGFIVILLFVAWFVAVIMGGG